MIDWLGSIAPKTLLTLAQSTDPLIRKRVAAYTKTNLDLLVYLATDTDPNVQYAVAQNPQTPIEILHEYVTSA
ncbi:MAG: hypothetical protein ACRCWD_08170, partial [Culicoidibacterales bacterium]